MKHGKLKAVLVIIIGLLLGYAVATQLGGFLGIEFSAEGFCRPRSRLMRLPLH